MNVRSNLLEAKWYLRCCFPLGTRNNAINQQGLYLVEDIWGIVDATAMMLHSLDKGNNALKFQFGTVCKMRTFISNHTHASVGGSGLTFMSQDGTISRILYASTNTLWFNCCMIGINQRMGDVWMPDKATSRYIIRASLKICEDMWTAAEGDDYGRTRTARASCVVIVAYFVDLRGE